ncbi:Methylamine utilisation protein MauE [Delftia tsuruhatensis]|uniref:MauE/DoxX family redox-associated membrane protein n=1 Tax=Delftia tsuruhatensis TaxID=180282 RepID=UPI001E793A06|nr:MauE/DoxX family redox-associated membrane protein [Delftia tsuruhatensis]CAB5692019.1 Methylamine utilisation protein MauE [Delftia tsuruhatensis]CAC9676808.1 Methylamine utilisation protein MauE [Delftia tsuruhatensis]
MPSLAQLSLVLLLGAVFALAAAGKLAAWHELPGVVGNFRVLPQRLVRPVALLLPVAETAIAAGLQVPAARGAAAWGAAALLLVFAAALAINLRRGRREIDCGCFRSDLRQPVSAALVLRNLLLALAALALAAWPSAALPQPVEWLLAPAAAATLLACYLATGLVFRPAPPRYEDNFRAGLDPH